MPRPVPPPPPQPSAEETRKAIRFSWVLMVVFAAAFWLIASSYGPTSTMVDYGRKSGQSWMRWKLADITEHPDKARPHDGPVVWLVGSSVMRDGFDEKAANTMLKLRGSRYRVSKFGQTRGAGGLAQGVVRRLPLQPGDLVLHNVMMENFQKDWVDFTDLPPARLSMMLQPRDFWRIEEWAFQDKLEQAAAIPQDFYAFHEDTQRGLLKWLEWPFTGKRPKEPKRSMHLTWKKATEIDRLERARAQGEASSYRITKDQVDFSPSQFNLRGMAEMQAVTEAAGAEYQLIYLPPRLEYRATFLTPEVREKWSAWLENQPQLAYFPQQPESSYYDMKHANRWAREAFTTHLVDWLEGGRPTGDMPKMDGTFPDSR